MLDFTLKFFCCSQPISIQIASHSYWKVYCNTPASPVKSSGGTPTPPIPMPPLKKAKLATTPYPVVVLDTNAASALLNGVVLDSHNKDLLLSLNPTWCDILRNFEMQLDCFAETKRARLMYEWAKQNFRECSLRVTTTTMAELYNATAVSLTITSRGFTPCCSCP